MLDFNLVFQRVERLVKKINKLLSQFSYSHTDVVFFSESGTDMYMMAFVTLMVALIGAYSQIYMKMAAKGFSQQTGVVDTMLAWHSTAIGLASKMVTSSSILAAPSGCSLTNITGTTGVPSFGKCKNGASADVVVGMSTAGLDTCSASFGAACVTLLPPNYNSVPYTFYSVVFYNTDASSHNHYYILTYVPPPPSDSDSYHLGLLCLPGDGSAVLTTCPHKQIPVTFNALYKQIINNKNIPPTSFGIVAACGANTCLNTQTLEYETYSGTTMTVVTTKQPFQYIVPSSANGVPIGSIGIITEFTPCPSSSCG